MQVVTGTFRIRRFYDDAQVLLTYLLHDEQSFILAMPSIVRVPSIASTMYMACSAHRLHNKAK